MRETTHEIPEQGHLDSGFALALGVQRGLAKGRRLWSQVWATPWTSVFSGWRLPRKPHSLSSPFADLPWLLPIMPWLVQPWREIVFRDQVVYRTAETNRPAPSLVGSDSVRSAPSKKPEVCSPNSIDGQGAPHFQIPDLISKTTAKPIGPPRWALSAETKETSGHLPQDVVSAWPKVAPEGVDLAMGRTSGIASTRFVSALQQASSWQLPPPAMEHRHGPDDSHSKDGHPSRETATLVSSSRETDLSAFDNGPFTEKFGLPLTSRHTIKNIVKLPSFLSAQRQRQTNAGIREEQSSEAFTAPRIPWALASDEPFSNAARPMAIRPDAAVPGSSAPSQLDSEPRTPVAPQLDTNARVTVSPSQDAPEGDIPVLASRRPFAGFSQSPSQPPAPNHRQIDEAFHRTSPDVTFFPHRVLTVERTQTGQPSTAVECVNRPFQSAAQSTLMATQRTLPVAVPALLGISAQARTSESAASRVATSVVWKQALPDAAAMTRISLINEDVSDQEVRANQVALLGQDSKNLPPSPALPVSSNDRQVDEAVYRTSPDLAFSPLRSSREKRIETENHQVPDTLPSIARRPGAVPKRALGESERRLEASQLTPRIACYRIPGPNMHLSFFHAAVGRVQRRLQSPEGLAGLPAARYWGIPIQKRAELGAANSRPTPMPTGGISMPRLARHVFARTPLPQHEPGLLVKRERPDLFRSDEMNTNAAEPFGPEAIRSSSVSIAVHAAQAVKPVAAELRRTLLVEMTQKVAGIQRALSSELNAKVKQLVSAETKNVMENDIYVRRVVQRIEGFVRDDEFRRGRIR